MKTKAKCVMARTRWWAPLDSISPDWILASTETCWIPKPLLVNALKTPRLRRPRWTLLNLGICFILSNDSKEEDQLNWAVLAHFSQCFAERNWAVIHKSIKATHFKAIHECLTVTEALKLDCRRQTSEVTCIGGLLNLSRGKVNLFVV